MNCQFLTAFRRFTPRIAAVMSSQRSITSFFATKATKNSSSLSESLLSQPKENTPPAVSSPKSPARAPRKRRIASSESESEQVESVVKRDAEESKPVISSSSGPNGLHQGESISYEELCNVFHTVESTTKRLEICAAFAQFFERLIAEHPQDLLVCVYLSINRLGPDYTGLELNVGEAAIIKAIAGATGRDIAHIKRDLASQGDLGKVALASKENQKSMFKSKPLTVQHVFKTMHEIATISGKNALQRRVDKMQGMLVACNGEQIKFLTRSMEGKLRIGSAAQSVLIALATASVRFHAKAEHRKASEEEIAAAVENLKAVYNEMPCYDLIIPALLDAKKYKDLARVCTMTPGIPLKPMLAHPTKSIGEVLDRFEGKTFTCEFKYDGERAQIHRLDDGKVIVYSRNSENMTGKYPDIVDKMLRCALPEVKSFVLDAEAVAWDVKQQVILPFQVLSTRRRKDVSASEISVQVCVFAFDLLYLNGEPLLQKPFRERRELLKASFKEQPADLMFAKSRESTSVEDIEQFLNEAIAGNCEGLMVKTFDTESTYEPSRRSRNWLKVKKDYLAGVGDSLDLVVIGGYHGRGKRTGVYGGFLLAAYDEDTETYQSITKIGTGFSEAQLEERSQSFREHVIEAPKPYYNYGGAKADVWFAPVQVWEVKAADLSISPIYQAAVGQVDNNKGISLRFPRFLRVRDDKAPEQATRSTQVAEMYRDQKLNRVADDDMEF